MFFLLLPHSPARRTSFKPQLFGDLNEILRTSKREVLHGSKQGDNRSGRDIQPTIGQILPLRYVFPKKFNNERAKTLSEKY
tara:strand:+ start:144 stop:386 length:243 start_codon:yes stop_codon:yes gene_type:complete